MRKATTCCALLLGLLLPLATEAQNTGQITGTVSSELRQPLGGVTVAVLGTALRVVTAADGRYTIANAPVGRQIVQATSIGYANAQLTVTVSSGETSVANFNLTSEAVEVSELVVVGYGTQRRDQVTGAVTTVTADKFVQGPARDAASLIAGKMPGLAVTQSSGNPLAGTQIQLRGRTTMQGPTNPLILVDGVPGNLQTAAAQDIETISVLKDGSAAAVYGTRASNGVILITTKRHAGGNPTLRYDGYISQSNLYRSPDFLTAADYRRLRTEGFPFEDKGTTTDWQDAVLREPMSYRHNLSLTGGAFNTNYTASLNLENEQGIFNRSDNREITARANIRHVMWDGKLEAEANLLNRHQQNFTGADYNYAWRQALIHNPTDSIVSGTGRWLETPGYFYVNPVALIEEVNGEAESRTTRLHGTLAYRPIPQLRISLMGGTSTNNSLSGSATTFQHSSNTVNNSGGTAGRSTNSSEDRILELTGTYSDRVADHNFTLLGGYGYQDEVNEGFNASNSRFPTDLFDWNLLQRGTGLLAGEAGTGIGSSKDSNKLIGFFGRLNYDWKNRYLFMASMRYEGSSKFGADHKWGMFPAVSAGWRISEESFMQGLSFVNDLRLRAGYGITGIAPNDSYLSLTSYSYSNQRFLYNGQWVQTLAPSRNPNPDLRWEEKAELNVGANFALFDSRLTGAIDVYQRETRDMLFNYSVPVPPNLNGSQLANVGTMQNNGIELELGYDVIRRPNLTWNTSANWALNNNKLKSLSAGAFQLSKDAFGRECLISGGTGEPIQQSTHRNCVGDPIGNFFGYKSVDIDENGIWIVEDSAGEHVSIRNATAGDRRVLGNGAPKQFFAWNNNVQFRNFDLNVAMRGQAQYQILNYYRMFHENPQVLQYNMLKSAFDPVYGKRKANGDPVLLNYDLSYVSYYIEDGDFIKLDNVTLGYTIPQNSLTRLSSVLSGARIYVSGSNLLTITGYKGLDPEVSTTSLQPGQEPRDSYPTIRRFTAGMTVSF